MVKVIKYGLPIWAILFLMPPTRWLAVWLLPLGRSWDDLLMLFAIGIVLGSLAFTAVHERRQQKELKRKQELERIRRMEEELHL